MGPGVSLSPGWCILVCSCWGSHTNIGEHRHPWSPLRPQTRPGPGSTGASPRAPTLPGQHTQPPVLEHRPQGTLLPLQVCPGLWQCNGRWQQGGTGDITRCSVHQSREQVPLAQTPATLPAPGPPQGPAGSPGKPPQPLGSPQFLFCRAVSVRWASSQGCCAMSLAWGRSHPPAVRSCTDPVSLPLLSPPLAVSPQAVTAVTR